MRRASAATPRHASDLKDHSWTLQSHFKMVQDGLKTLSNECKTRVRCSDSRPARRRCNTELQHAFRQRSRAIYTFKHCFLVDVCSVLHTFGSSTTPLRRFRVVVRRFKTASKRFRSDVKRFCIFKNGLKSMQYALKRCPDSCNTLSNSVLESCMFKH